MNRRVKLLLLGAVAAFSGGCVEKTAPMYYFGKTESALYASKKAPNEENERKLREALDEVIARSNKDGMRVPPGVYAHLGYLMLMDHRKDEAVQYFVREKQLYPEATVFMDRMINQAEMKTQEEGGKKDA
jgi:hypothetical protein